MSPEIKKIMVKREYIEVNKDWLEAKAKENDVKALPKGIYYKVLSEGNQDSARPTVRSIITAHYTGRTIDGKDAYWRQVGTLYPSRDGLWQILPAWHPWWLDSYF